MLVVWALAALMAGAVFVTYSTVSPQRLYHVTGEGLEGGVSRAIVLLCFPIAVLALPVLPVIADRLRRAHGVAARERTVVGTLTVVSAALCATVAVSVDQSDLDVSPANAAAAIGVLLAIGLTWHVVRRTGVGHLERSYRRTTAAAVVVLALAGLPWIAADVGLSLGRVPLANEVFNATEQAVHLGHHHGLDGVVLAIAAIVMWPAVASMRPSRLRSLATFLVALELVYGLANALQDGWNEQFVKRGWSQTDLPSVLHPAVTPAWAAMLLVTAALWWLGMTVHERHDAVPPRDASPDARR